MRKFLSIGYWIVFLFYLFLLIDTVFFGRDARRSINLTPFEMMKEQGFTLNVWGNVLMFIPLGIYFSNFMKRFHFGKVFGAVIGTSLSIEVIQFIFNRGSSDIDDLILNTIGGLIGILIYLLFKLIIKSKERVQTAISILSIVVGAPVVLLVIILFVYN